MADQKITITAKPSKIQQINVTSNRIANEIVATPDTSLYYSNLSKQWATRMDGLVVNEDYSSKYYAEKSKQSAETAKMEASTVNSLIPELQETFTTYNATLSETAGNAITEININRDYAITQVNTTSADAVSIVEQTLSKAVSDVNGLSNKAITEITQEAQKQIANIESTGFYMRDDKLYFIDSNGEEQEFKSGGGTLQMFDTVLKDHILTFEESQGLALQGTYVYKEAISGSRYGYPDFYNKCLEEKETATATETTLGSNIVTIYANANGHRFYDIADKSIIDEWYETYGIADFYGVDTENERIFLPRNKHFMQLTDDTSKVNEMVEAGLPNIYGSTILAADNENNPYSGAFVPSTVHNSFTFDRDASGGWGVQRTVIFDASRSNATYGKSDTIQPQASLKLLYYCVGNTSSLSAITDVTQITTSENDTLPLFHNFYSQEDMTSTGAYVNASLGSWLSGNVYETAYNELVNKIGTDNVKAVTDTYTDYDFVVNQDDMTFRLPLLNGEESLPSDKRQTLTILPSDSTYTASQNGWYSYLVVSSVANGTVNLYCEETGIAHLTQANANMASRGSIPVSKGDVVNYIYPTNSTNILFFVPAKGDGNLYYKVANAVTNLELLNAGEVLNAVNSLIPDNSSLIAGYAMPSNKYIDLTLGATETEYTSPANGWINIVLKANGAIGWVGVKYDAVNFISVSPTVTERFSVCVPIKKGTKFTVGYGNCYAEHFRFIYAQGSESEV